MKVIILKIIISGLLYLLINKSATADVLWLKNGDRLTGSIEEITNKLVRIVPAYSLTLTISRDEVKRWRLDRPEHPMKRAEKNTPRLSALDESNPWLWRGSSDLNIKLKNKKNKKTNNINFKASTEFANKDWRYSMDGEYIYETTKNATDNHGYKLSPSLDLFFDENTFIRTSIRVDYSLIDISYLHLDYALGPGYRFWNDKKHRLEVTSQLGLEQTYFLPDMWNTNSFFDEKTINYPFVRLGWDYRNLIPLWQIQLELFSKGNYQKYVSQPSHYLTLAQSLNGRVGLRYYLNDHLRLSWSSELDLVDGWISLYGTRQSLSEKELRHIITLGASF